MGKDNIWYGFLQAGEKSSPVVRDAALETKSLKTVYLFNYTRGEFLEYSREIVEPKLRELNSDDVSLAELKRAFKAARKAFQPAASPAVSAVRAGRRKADVLDIGDVETSDDQLDGFTPGDDGFVVEDDAYG